MKPSLPCLVLASVVTLAAAGLPTFAQTVEPADPAPPPGRPTREELREQLKNLSPEERQAKLREMRERAGGPTGPQLEKRRAEFEKMRQELQGLPPAERAARLQQWRQTNGFGTNSILGPIPPRLNPADSEAKRGEFRERIQSELKQLKAKEAAGTLTPEETRRLQRMIEWSERLKAAPDGPGGPAGGRRPAIDQQFPKPVEPAPAGK